MGRADLFCRFVGTSFEARRWLTIDPCGLLCITLSFSVHAYAISIIAYLLISKSVFSQVLYVLFYLPCALLALWSLYTAWTTDPGAVPMGARPLTKVKKVGTSKKERAIRRCAKCNDNYKPPRAHHDSVTGRCIVKMDHFCPWVCNAVGALNHKFFVLFIFYTLLSCLMTIVLIAVRVVHCSYVIGGSSSDNEQSMPGIKEATWTEEEPTNDMDPDRSLEEFAYPECNGLYDNYLLLILFICALTFMIFTCTMLFEQIEAIESNTGKIARMKMKIGQGGTELERVTTKFNEMFGGDSASPQWHWFLPLQVRFPDGMQKVVLGYEWDPTFGDEPYQEDDMVAALQEKVTSSLHDDHSDLEVGLKPPTATESDAPLTPESSSPEGSSHGISKPKKRVLAGKKNEPKFVDNTKEID